MRAMTDVAPRIAIEDQIQGRGPGATSTAPVNVTPRTVTLRTPDPKFPPAIAGDAPDSAATTTIELFAPPLHEP